MLASFAANGPIICTCLFGIITKRHISGPLHRYHIITPCIQGEEGRMAGGDSDMCLNQMDVLSSAHRFYWTFHTVQLCSYFLGILLIADCSKMFFIFTPKLTFTLVGDSKVTRLRTIKFQWPRPWWVPYSVSLPTVYSFTLLHWHFVNKWSSRVTRVVLQ